MIQISLIRDTEPDKYELLTTILVPFRQYPADWHMAGRYPTVELLGGDIYRVRDCCVVIDTYQFVRDYDEETRERGWQAYRTLRRLMEDPARTVQVTGITCMSRVMRGHG